MKVMQMDSITIHNQSKLIENYRSVDGDISCFFDYHPFNDYRKRAEDLRSREFNRTGLADVLLTMNRKWNAPESALENIERLRGDDSMVVVGGQQAGILTGPLYTINKLISVITLARKQENELGKPVIPVFWIAGEDHDFDEINHIYLSEIPRLRKSKIPQQQYGKQSASSLLIDKENSAEWVDFIFSQLKETIYTKDLYKAIKESLEQSLTYVDFFAQLIFRLFEKEGIVLVDSGSTELRQLESSHFVQMVERQQEINGGVMEAYEQLRKKGYSISLEIEEDQANLFYHLNGERILLYRDEEGNWKGKQDEVKMTTEELIAVAKSHPEQLSNNVVTRPLMQELLFPSLAFVGGPGEIGYWAALKPAFRSLRLNMPPVVPRLSFTLVDRKVRKAMDKYGISAEEAVNKGIAEQRENWLASLNNPPISKIVEELKSTLDQAHKPLRETAQDIRADIGDLADKNLEHLNREIDFLHKRMVKAVEETHKKEFHEFDHIQAMMFPNAGLQERTWNPLPFLNENGETFIQELLAAEWSFEKDHYVVWL
ncbi:bacillithiol biosynthesis cysteine-adding enzyme BshC [Virgibacillus xinjiangensis]|uniref:Putative cysteine ligase BshC n=1 Tax=Virgibacillus xinjiangensis TaxID=393090 RepID=A0ABV7CV61_9BACI